MRILHVVPTYLPATRYGGPIYAVHGMARALVARGHEVEVITTNVDGDGDSAVAAGSAATIDGVTVRYCSAASPMVPSRLARRLYVSESMSELLAANVARFDILHLHSVFLWPTWAAARAAQRASVPYVVSPRGMLVPELIREKNRLAKTAWLTLMERKNLARAAGIHFTSDRERLDAARTGLPLPDPFVVPNGVDLPAPGERHPQTLLYLGRVSWKKRVDTLIDAVARLTDVTLVICGPDDEGLVPRLRERAHDAGVGDRVEFRDGVSGEAKQALLRSAFALALPSQSENFGNVVLEALAVETPVIVTPEVGLAADVEAANAGIVLSNDPVRLADAIERLRRDPVSAAAMGKRGRAMIEERFTWGRVAAAMEAAYARIVERTHR